MQDRKKELLENLIVCRKFEEKVSQLYQDGELTGWTHLGIGQEASVVGSIAAIENRDYITITHRGHIHTVMKGADLEKVFAELLGKNVGVCGGRSGSLHLADMESNNFGSSAIVGGNAPISTGIALYLKLFGNGSTVSLCFLGDGALATGAVSESMNIASLWNLPVVFICENNQYGEMTPLDVHHPAELRDRAKPFGMPVEKVDGMDVLKVKELVSEVVEETRRGSRPALVITDTYRFCGHYEGDPQFYRSDEEIEKWKEKDPIKLFSRDLIEEGVIDGDDLETIEEEVDGRIEEAVEFARESDRPEPEDAYKHGVGV